MRSTLIHYSFPLSIRLSSLRSSFHSLEVRLDREGKPLISSPTFHSVTIRIGREKGIVMKNRMMNNILLEIIVVKEISFSYNISIFLYIISIQIEVNNIPILGF